MVDAHAGPFGSGQPATSGRHRVYPAAVAVRWSSVLCLGMSVARLTSAATTAAGSAAFSPTVRFAQRLTLAV